MNKPQKLEYQHKIEKYFEDHKVYDIFENLLKLLVREKPEDPVSFIISKLENPERNFQSSISKTHIYCGTSRISQEG